MTTTRVLAAAFVLLAPLSAAAQGPMTIEPIGSGFAGAPEIKQTEVDHRAGTLIGGTGGYILDEAFFIGGGGYWLANNSSNREMGYGGFVMQWIGRGSDHVGFAARMLIGGGTATLTDTVTQYVVVAPPMPTSADGRPDQTHVPTPPVTRPVTSQVRVHTDFFVFEPQADLHVRFSPWARLTAGAGYRFIGDYWNHYYYGGYNDTGRLQGWVGTLGVQFGGGF